MKKVFARRFKKEISLNICGCSIVVFLLTAIFFNGSLFADGLKWDKTTLELKAAAADKKVNAEFSFTNTSSSPIELRNIRTSCGCTTAEPSQKVIEPNESGSINVTFNFGGRKGVHEKMILVEASESPQQVLILRVEIPDSVKVDKEILTWNVGGIPQPQFFEITVMEPQSTIVKSVRGVDAKFEAKMEEVEAGKKYRVEVKPLATDKASSGAVRLDIEDPDKRTIHLRVEVKS